MVTPRNMLDHASRITPISVILGQTVQASVIMEIRQENMTPRIPPFKVTQGHWNRYGSIGNLCGEWVSSLLTTLHHI